jgi:HAD superfamily hydrolase (TIGR01509 family)
MATIQGVIFDIDGTLVDSNDAHAESWVETFREFGRDVPFTKVRSLIGMGGDKLLPECVGLADDSPEGKAMSKHRTDLFKREYLPNLDPFPGTRDLLERLKADGYRLAIATSAKSDELTGLLRAAGALGIFDESTTKSDVENSKPDPDAIHSALGKLGLAPHEVVMVGDTPYDVEAANKAGVRAVALRCGGWKDADLAAAAAVYDDPADLLKHLEHSPIGREP